MRLKSNPVINEQVLKVMLMYERMTRKELAQITGYSDRVVRLAIAELRDKGYMIGITASGGYSINDPVDFRRAIANYKSRAAEEERRIRVMEQTLNEYLHTDPTQLEGQLGWSF